MAWGTRAGSHGGDLGGERRGSSSSWTLSERGGRSKPKMTHGTLPPRLAESVSSPAILSIDANYNIQSPHLPYCACSNIKYSRHRVLTMLCVDVHGLRKAFCIPESPGKPRPRMLRKVDYKLQILRSDLHS